MGGWPDEVMKMSINLTSLPLELDGDIVVLAGM